MIPAEATAWWSPESARHELNSFDWKSSVLTVLLLVPVSYVARKAWRLIKGKRGRGTGLGLKLIKLAGNDTYVKRAAFRAYCRIQLNSEETKYLPVPGSRGVTLKTDEVYIPLRLENADRTVVATVRDLWRSGVKRIRIVGDPGSGKSSFVKQLFRHSCRLALADQNQSLPVAINLKEFVPSSELVSDEIRADWALHEICRQIGAAPHSDLERLFTSSLESRGVLLLLDGLDEVASESFVAVAEVVNALSRHLERTKGANRIVLTMRTQFHHQVRHFFMRTFPPTFYIQQFTPGEIYAFLQRWPFAEAERRTDVNRLYSELTDKPTLREMCSNPLILAMYVARDQQGQRTGSADNRTGFYKQVAEELLVARRSRQLGVAAKNTLLQQRESIMGQLALENLLDPEQPANQIYFVRALQVVRQVVRSSTVEQAEDYLRDMCKDTGLMTEERDGETLAFIHLTFCEFLAAKEAVEGQMDGVQRLLDAQKAFSATNGWHRTSVRLTEVIPFALGLLPRVARGSVLGQVSDLADASVLGRCFLESQQYEHSAWQNYLAHEAKFLTDTKSYRWDEDWLRRLHLFSVVLADEAEWASLSNRKPSLPLDSLFKKLIKKDRDRLSTIFDSYATFDAQAAFRLAYACGVDLVRESPHLVVKYMSDPPFLATLIEQCRKDHDGAGGPWVMLFAEGALSSAFVATRLSQERWSVLPHTVKDPRDLKPNRRWFVEVSREYSNEGGGMLRLSLLTYVLSVALKDVDPHSHVEFTRLHIMRNAAPPATFGSLRSLRFGRTARLIAMMSAVFIPSALLAVTTRSVVATITAAGVAGILASNLDALPALASRYYTAMLLQSERVISSIPGNPLTAPARAFAFLTVARATLAADRIENLRNLRVASGEGWEGGVLDTSPAEILSSGHGIGGRTHRL